MNMVTKDQNTCAQEAMRFLRVAKGVLTETLLHPLSDSVIDGNTGKVISRR